MNEVAVTAPGAFAYYQNRDSAAGRALRRRLEWVANADLSLPDDVIAGFGASMNAGDQLSDAYINAAFSGPDRRRARTLVEQALNAGIESVTDPTPELIALFRQIDADPEWLNWDTVEHGAEVFRRYGSELYPYFGMITFAGYLSPTVAKPLALTGAYTGGSAFGRFLETCRFWTDTSEPRALRPGGAGRRSAVLVRILHSIIRHTLLPHNEWDRERLGMPLSQADQFTTLLAGSHGPGQQLKLLGYRPSDEDIVAMMHLQRYIGHLMGVEPYWYPQTATDGFRAQLLIVLSAKLEAGPDGRNLCASFMDQYRPADDAHGLRRVLGRLNYRAQLGHARFYVGRSIYGKTGLPDPGLWRFAPLTRFVPNFARETARRHIPGAAGRIDQRHRQARQAFLRTYLKDGEAKFRPVDKLSR